MIRGGSQNYIVGVLWDRAIVLIFWCPFRFFMLCSLLCSLLNIELTFSQCSSFFLKSLKNDFWYFKIVEYFLYYLLSHQLPPMNDKPWNGLARIAAPCSQSIACTGSDIGVQQAGRGVAISGARLPICRWTVKGAGLRWEQHGTTWMIVEVNNFRVRLYVSFHTIQKGQLML